MNQKILYFIKKIKWYLKFWIQKFDYYYVCVFQTFESSILEIISTKRKKIILFEIKIYHLLEK